MNTDNILSEQTRRTRWVDYARAIGIVLVVYGHVARGVNSAGLLPDQQLFSVIDSIIYTFHIPLFFFLSGLFFIGSLSSRSPHVFVMNKVGTIIYPYAVWSLTQGTVEVIFGKYTNGSVTMAQVMSFLWAPRAQFWFLYVLFLMFVAAAVVYSRLSPKYYLPVLILAVCLYIIKNRLPETLAIRFFAANLVFFSFGVYCNKSVSFFEKNRWHLLVVFLSLFVVFQLIFHFDLRLTFRTDMTWLVLPVSLVSILGITFLCQALARFDWPWLSYLGRASLIIYVMHILVAAGVRVFSCKVLGISSPGFLLVTGVTTGIIVPLLIRVGIKRSGLRFLYRPMGITD